MVGTLSDELKSLEIPGNAISQRPPLDFLLSCGGISIAETCFFNFMHNSCCELLIKNIPFSVADSGTTN